VDESTKVYNPWRSQYSHGLLCRLAHEEVVQLHKGRKALPPPGTLPMRDAVLA
jgi:hypothetical protein